jgi:hypothetical protein
MRLPAEVRDVSLCTVRKSERIDMVLRRSSKTVTGGKKV